MESKGSSRALPRIRSRQTLAPSDPQFDRTTLSDHEYIELLLFENKELASVIVQRDKTIAALEERVKSLSIDKEDSSKERNSDSGRISDNSNSLKPANIGESGPPVIAAEIPHRSARRRRNSNQNGSTQTPPDILSTTTIPQEVSPTAPTNKDSITNHLDTGGSMPKISLDPSISLIEDPSTSSPTVTLSPIGVSEKLVNPLSERSVHSYEKSVNSSVKSAGFTAYSANSTNSTNSANSTSSRDKLPDTAPLVSNYLKGTEKTEDNDNSTLNESILTVDSDPNISVNDSFGNIKNSPSDTHPIYPETSNENKSVYSDNKYNQSSSSFSSYKSRIKLPPTLHLQKQQLQNLVKKQSSTSQLPNLNHLNEPTSPKMSREGDGNSLYQTNLKSPALFNHSSHDNLRSGRDTPQTSQFPYAESSRLIPRTPDAFSTGKFPTKFQDNNQHPSDDTHSYISSPIQGSFRNPQMSPDRSNYKGSYDSDALRSPLNNGYMSTDSVGTPRPSAQTPGSSFHVLSTPKLEEDDTCLLIKPEEFNTINVTVVSTINTAPQSKRSDDPNCTFSISDRDSEKEMWRIRKTYSQLVAFDNEIRPIVEYFGLPALPERILFNSSSPGKIELRRISLQNYFNTLFVMPHIPQMVLYRICRYLSLDFVNPLDDYKSGARKEGFLIRRYKGLGTSWKVRWCQVDGPFLEVYEVPGGAVLEQIKLRGALIGRQSNDSVAEDKGYRHALLIMEPQKPKLTSSYAKHFFCAETDEERDDWVEALLEFNDSFSGSNDVDQQSIPPESPLPKYEYQEELDHSNRLQTPSLNYTMGSHSHSNDQISSITVISDDSVKEQKKAKKRSYFPFRTKINGVNLGSLLSSDNITDVDPSNVPVPHTPQDGSMQHYLDQLNLDEDLTKRIFGREIEDAFELSNGDFLGRQIPSICLRCLDFLIKTGAVYEEGIFRLSGSASAIRQLKERFNTQFDLDLFECDLKPDMHTVAGLFKTYLRELPNPIMGGSAYNHLNSIILLHGLQIVPSQLAVIFRDYFANPANISQVHYDMCYVLFKFLNQVIANHKTNRMNLRNVCIVFVPTLNISIEILTTFLVDFDCIFENGAPVADDKREVLDLHIPNF